MLGLLKPTPRKPWKLRDCLWIHSLAAALWLIHAATELHGGGAHAQTLLGQTTADRNNSSRQGMPLIQGRMSRERKFALTHTAPAAVRCAVAKGKWCEEFLMQEEVVWKLAPRGSKECPNECNGVGRCNYDTGYCDCVQGWTGVGCKTPQKRPCTADTRHPDNPSKEPISHIGPDKRDLNWTVGSHTYSRCGGICDDDLAICYCDGQGPDQFGRIPPPPGSPPGTPPIRVGRPLVTEYMAPNQTWNGRQAFGKQPYDNVYGPRGYCNVSKPVWAAVCGMDGLGGPTCDDPIESFCPGACSGHGTCYLGYCYCDEGYYGHDCARRKAGMALLPSRIPTSPWLASVVRQPPAALEPPPAPTRKRPLIYVYDLEPLYQARILQYRVSPPWCVHRHHLYPGNTTEWTDVWVYAVDSLLHESFLLSEHRTFDPEEADFFYVPHQATCLPFPIGRWADFPWFGGTGGPRPRQMINFIREVVNWIDTHYPFWKRRQGRDHIWTWTHDEGACWAPTVLNNSIWLTHWGRMEFHHTSHGIPEDNYNKEFKSVHQPEGYLAHIQGHPCYNPEKDLVIPSFKGPRHYHKSGLVGNPTRERDVLFYFKGDVGKGRFPQYSRGVRQGIYKLAKAGDWASKHNFLIGDRKDVPGGYSDMLSRSIFCLVAAGDGWSGRMEDAMLHGCIPVIIIDNVHVVFESILDVESFSIRIAQKDVPRILEILQAVPERKIRSMQAHLGHVWHRFRYSSLPGLAHELVEVAAANKKTRARDANAHNSTAHTHVPLPRAFKGDPSVDDAFTTILQWLHSRIPYTR